MCCFQSATYIPFREVVSMDACDKYTLINPMTHTNTCLMMVFQIVWLRSNEYRVISENGCNVYTTVHETVLKACE